MTIQKSESIKELAAALAKTQSKIFGAAKSETNPFFKSNYADLASVWEAIRQPMTDNGISVSQLTDTENEHTYVTTILMHSSGEWLASTLRVANQKNDAQSIGSAITYARRYSLASMLCVPQIDDDGEATMHREDPKPSKKDANELLRTIEKKANANKPIVTPQNVVSTIVAAVEKKPAGSDYAQKAIAKIAECKTQTELNAIIDKVKKITWDVDDSKMIDAAVENKINSL